MISVLILTKNEQTNLPECLQSVSWSNDIVVFDSYSTDRTCEIAEAFGARVIQRTFDNYGAQREAARQVDYRNQWVLALDADERPDEQLVDEMQRIASSSETKPIIYRMRRKDHFMGRWIKRTTLYPSWFLRFYRPTHIRYKPRAVHEYPDYAGEAGMLNGHLLHYSFNKGLTEWLLKHVRYAELEASENLSNLQRTMSLKDLAQTISTDPIARRHALKQLSFRMPFRPALRFFYSYFVRFGFLDGYAGFQYCLMLAMYERMIVLNLLQQRYHSDTEHRR